MLIIGAKGFAKEILEILHQQGVENIAFYDDINQNGPNFLFDKFPILKNKVEAVKYFEKVGYLFTIGIGNPFLRHQLYSDFIALGGVYTSSVSPTSQIGSFDITIGEGCNILNNTIISNSVKIGRGCILYYNSVITHDCIIGNFVEISPGVSVLGRCKIGEFSQLGSGSIVLPDVNIGSNVIVAAGAVVTKDLPNNCMAAGVPAVIKKHFKSHVIS